MNPSSVGVGSPQGNTPDGLDPTAKVILERLFPCPSAREMFREPGPLVVFCGLPRSGKSSITRVVYAKNSPHETLYLLSTPRPEVMKIANTNLAKFKIVEIPGSFLLDAHYDEVLFPSVSAMVFVIDAQNEPYTHEITYCKLLFKRAWQINPNINLEVFIHKIDGDVFTVDEVRAECQRDIHDKLMSHLHEEGVAANVVFYSTSIYDHTVFEACSRVIKRLLPQASALDQLLDALVTNCRMEKAFLIDVYSKTFIAADTSPFDPFNYELCTDMVDLVIEISCIYGMRDPTEALPANGGDSSSSGTSSLIQLSTGHVLYLREVDRLVALACVIRGENFDRQHLVDYNIRIFRDAMLQFFTINSSLRQGTLSAEEIRRRVGQSRRVLR